jgi:hypothetical protein
MGAPRTSGGSPRTSPFLPDVWIEYGKDPAGRVEVLLTPHNESDAPAVARALRERLRRDAKTTPRVLYNESVVLAALSFSELLRGALPITAWWQRSVTPIRTAWTRSALKTFAKQLTTTPPGSLAVQGTDPKLLQKLIRIVGYIDLERRGKPVPDATSANLTEPEIDASASLFDKLEDPKTNAGILWGISVNRRASTSVWRSRLTVKADAAARLFDSPTTGIRWAVLDTGIDATHPAFKRRSASGSIVKPSRARRPASAQPDDLNSRVVRSFNFLRIKDLLDPDADIPLDGTAASALPKKELAEQADYLNRTIPNLSSIVVLVEAARRRARPFRLLLTGDAGGDHILESLDATKLGRGGRFHVDLLKVQHHGSNHSVTQDFFERVTADRYVISGNGRHDIPHRDTLEWLSTARRGERYELFMTNRSGSNGLTQTLTTFLTREARHEPKRDITSALNHRLRSASRSKVDRRSRQSAVKNCANRASGAGAA